MNRTTSPRVTLQYEVDRVQDGWELPEGTAPESRPHDLSAELLRQLLVGWVERTGQRLQVGRNIALRWDQTRPKVGVDPDVYVASPPPEGDAVRSLRLWDDGYAPPRLCIEIVSAGHPWKDHVAAPEKYAASGTEELWIFDPELAGPKVRGGPHRLQVWERSPAGELVRAYAGDGPAWSAAVGAWLFAVNEGSRLRIADDAAGTSWWRTPMEEERAAKEAERAAKEVEQAAKEAALKRIAELEAELSRLAK